MTGSSVAYILNKQSCAVIGSAAIDSHLQTPIPNKWLILQRNGMVEPTSLKDHSSIRQQKFLYDSSDGKKIRSPFPNLPNWAPANA